jgi:hypothetical protein
MIDESFKFNCVEIFDSSKKRELIEKHPELDGYKIISDSDAHYLENMRIPEDCYIEVKDNTIQSILDYFR